LAAHYAASLSGAATLQWSLLAGEEGDAAAGPTGAISHLRWYYNCGKKSDATGRSEVKAARVSQLI